MREYNTRARNVYFYITYSFNKIILININAIRRIKFDRSIKIKLKFSLI